MSREPWDIRTDDSRTEDTVATFIIFCEDEVSEPIYLRSFTVPGRVKINAVENQNKHWLNLRNAIIECEKNDLLEKSGGAYKIKGGVTANIWSAYDRDMESEEVNALVQANDAAFSLAIQTSESIGIKVAWSNDAFELWLLLHFETVPSGARLHRSYIYRRLTYVLKELPNQSAEMQRVTGRDEFNYKEHFKKRINFAQHILPLLTNERRVAAIANARLLEQQYDHNVLFHERNPYTKIHHLIEEILAVQ